ncbi:MAG: phage holin family protein [Actinomyces ruminicola]|uniref:Putative Holin-X, holin superfamily III n=1 Tax=Actinomyces ruminicola TaxID=332524 RepID=A0A1G9WS06_9ACTO|nr:phage holin family protein [Actinomyces ruminicola]MBE6482223.1 phage holin family protein [Actinomyces ruminicola]SDM86963.1 Putative Holin-X, holin superfamily III [Actinomyces ruminicola]
MSQQGQQPNQPPSMPPRSAAATAAPTLSELVGRISDNVSALVHGEIDLAKAKGKRMAATMGVGGALLAVGGVIALYGVGFLLGTFVELIALALPLWAAKLIVAVVLLLVAAIAAWLGVKRLQAAKADVPDPKGALQHDLNTVKSAAAVGFEKGNQK